MNRGTQRVLDTMIKMRQLNRRGWSLGGIGKGEFMTLCAIEEFDQNEEGPLTASKLSKKTQVSAAAMSQMLNILEKKGFVKREQSSADRRSVFISLTEPGASLLENAKRSFERRVTFILSALGQEDSERLADILEKLYERVKELDDRGLPEDEDPFNL